MKILVADDDPEQLGIRCMLLEQSGFETIQASDGLAAMKIACEKSPDCAVIDLRLPTEELGLQLIRNLRTLRRSMRLIVLTGGDPQHFAAHPESELVDELIVKGSPAGHLVAKLKTFAAGARG